MVGCAWGRGEGNGVAKWRRFEILIYETPGILFFVYPQGGRLLLFKRQFHRHSPLETRVENQSEGIRLPPPGEVPP